MTDQEIEDILGAEPQIEPSPGFAAAVMRAVHRDVATPPAITFPWVLALPGIIAWVLTLTLLIAVPLYDSGTPSAPAFHLQFDVARIFAWLPLAFDSLRRSQAVWVALAVLLTLACVGLPLRLIRGGSGN